MPSRTSGFTATARPGQHGCTRLAHSRGCWLLASCLILIPALARAQDPVTRRDLALSSELRLLQAATQLERGMEGARHERESLAFAMSVHANTRRDVARQLASYRAHRLPAAAKARRSARAVYKLSRGGATRLLMHEDPQPGLAQRNARILEYAMRSQLEDLEVYRRAEERAASDLLAAHREQQALATLTSLARGQATALRVTRQQLGPILEQQRFARKVLLSRGDKPLSREERQLVGMIQKSRARLARRRGLDLLEADSLSSPTGGKIVGQFGDYRDPVLGVMGHRDGVELRAPPRKPVVAMAAGNVVMVTELSGFDQVVVIDHGGGYHSLVGRLITTAVTVGEEVRAGSILGMPAAKRLDDGLGATIYLEVRHGERAVDPTPYLTRGGQDVPAPRDQAMSRSAPRWRWSQRSGTEPSADGGSELDAPVENEDSL